MEKYRNLILYMTSIILIVNIQENLSIYLSCGMNQLNNFIYLDRMKIYTFQNYSQICSLNMGPNCYFIEDKNILKYETNNNELNIENKISDINFDYKREWMETYMKSKMSSYLNNYIEINSIIQEYKNNLLKRNDSKQIPPSINLYLSLTFESYDDITINGDIYAYPSKSITFFTENVIIEIIGKLRLHYGEDMKINKQIKYPTKTFGIVESPEVTIRLGGKRFICEFFFLRIRDAGKNKENVYGYFGQSKVFSISIGKYIDNKTWNKISLPQAQIDRIILPKGIDVDNFKFVIETNKQYDITVQFHYNKKERIKNLVEDDDIY
jgi:hypothetical protein